MLIQVNELINGENEETFTLGQNATNKCEWSNGVRMSSLGHRPMASKESSIYAKTSRWALNEEQDVCINY